MNNKKILQIAVSTTVAVLSVYLIVAAWTEPELAPPSGNISTPYDVPVGTVLTFANSSVPSGWLECNGAAVSRTTYAALFAAVGTSFGSGDGSTTFNVPDLRGQFVRGWDHSASQDPNAASRVALISGGATGDNIGSYQADELKSHFHTVQHPQTYGLGAGPYPYGAGGSENTSSTGGSETRPENVYLMYIVKY